MPVSPLRNRTFRSLFTAQVVALFGTGLTTVALALLAYRIAPEQAGSVLGTALAIKMIAYVGFAPAASAAAEKLPRRTMLVVLDLVRAAVVLCLPFVESVWQIYALILLLSAAAAGFTPVFQATIPDVLDDEEQYTRALSWSRIAYDLENLLSPALAAMLLTVTVFDTLFVLNAVAFVISAALVLSVALPPWPAQRHEGGMPARMRYGAQIYLRTARLRALLLFFLAVALGGAMVIVNTVVYVRTRLDLSEFEVAVAYAAFGGGSMIVALVLPRLLGRIAERTVTASGAGLIAAALAGAAALPGFPAFLTLWFALGAGTSLVQTPAGRLLRRSCHDEDRSAVYSAHFALSHLCWLIAYPLAGHAGSLLGLSVTFVIVAALSATATAAGLLLWPAEDRIVIEHEHGNLVHTHWHEHDEHHQHRHEGQEPAVPHRHRHRHPPLRHAHPFVIDHHHQRWP